MRHADKKSIKARRHGRIRAKIAGVKTRPRLTVFRSNAHMYVQLVDDANGRTIAASSDKDVKGGKTPMEKAALLGALFAEKAKQKNIAAVVFDRSGYKYHGLVKAFAQGAREGGLQF